MLVAQDPNDEPTSELLRRIVEHKARLVNRGQGRKEPLLPEVSADEMPFKIPGNWRWVRFANIADFSAGRTPSRNETSFWNNGGHAWVSIADMDSGQLLTKTKERVTDKAREKIFRSEPEEPGTIIMSFKLTIGKIARLGIPAFHNEAIISIRPALADLDSYLFSVLPQFAKSGATKGAIKGATLNRSSISNILIPLPPVAEQHRIVAKIDELMALCDQLELAQNEREACRDRLVAASLHRIGTAAATAAEAGAAAAEQEAHATPFPEAVRFHLTHLSRLTTRPEHIKQLRETILDLAVRGRLVAQDPNDEPAIGFVERMSRDILEYAESQRIAHAVIDPIEEALYPFPRPLGWEFVRLSSLFRVITDGDHQPPPKAASGVAFLTIGNITSGTIDFSNCRYVSRQYADAIPAYRKPSQGDILYTVVGATYGRPALVDSEREFCVQRHIAILKPAAGAKVGYLRMLLASPFVYEQATKCLTGTAQPTLGLRPLRNFIVPVPSPEEQNRIAAKVDKLMALCDQIEAQLNQTQADSRRILDAVLRESLEVAAELEEA